MADLQSKMELMEGLQSRMAALQADKEAIEEENNRLREAAARGSGRRRKGSSDSEDDSDDEDGGDRATLASYLEKRAAVMAALRDGQAVGGELYAEREVLMFRLSDTDLQAEYEWYTRLYLGDETKAPVLCYRRVAAL